MTPATERAQGWTPAHLALLGGGLFLGLAIRAFLLPTDGYRGDIDQFVVWVNGIANGGIGRTYDQNLSFPPVMAYVWGLLATIEPAFRTVTDAADPWIRSLMKLPASLADIGLALGVGWALRGRPSWAVAGALAIALHPAVIDVSAWWGQYESIYVLGGLVAFLLAVSGRPAWAAVALAIALMTKPQALPFFVPFGAWFLGRYGLVASLRYAAVGAATIVVLWLPFVAAGGPANYLRNLAEYQNDIFAVLSLRAWNPWWLIQAPLAGGDFVSDTNAILGPITFRILGLVSAAILELVVFLAVLRAPTTRTLALGLAAATLVAFVALTTMHERYSFGALIFLAVLLPARPVRWLWVALSVCLTLNLLAAVPGSVVPIAGPLGILGSVAFTLITATTLWLLLKRQDDRVGVPALQGSVS